MRVSLGATGWLENESEVQELAELSFSKPVPRRRAGCWLFRRIPPIRSVRDLRGKRVATEAVGLTRRFLSAPE